MSLRLRLLAAFGYVLVFAILALEVPLTLNFSRRVNSRSAPRQARERRGSPPRRRARSAARPSPTSRAGRRRAWAAA